MDHVADGDDAADLGVKPQSVDKPIRPQEIIEKALYEDINGVKIPASIHNR